MSKEEFQEYIANNIKEKRLEERFQTFKEAEFVTKREWDKFIADLLGLDYIYDVYDSSDDLRGYIFK